MTFRHTSQLFEKTPLFARFFCKNEYYTAFSDKRSLMQYELFTQFAYRLRFGLFSEKMRSQINLFGFLK